MPDAPRLLVVDDEVALAWALRDTLAHRGFEVEACTAPQEALRLIGSRSFDLLLTDLNMPGMDGIALLARAQALAPGLAVVIMTGAGTIATAVSAMQAGALDYILKPFKLDLALPVLQRALEIRSLRLQNRALQLRLEEQLAELAMANGDLEAFSSSVSHDLRAPLQAIAGFSAEIARSHAQGLDAKGQDYLDRIRAAVTRMEDMVDGLLRLSRIARQPLAMGCVLLDELAAEVAADLRDAGQAGAVSLVLGRLPQAQGDRALLRQLLFNLLANACKFSAHRTDARVELGCEDDAAGPVFHVRDNGVGFDPAHAAHLFEPFQRLHRADEFPGLGLGLSIVQRIVHKHGGRIWADSAPGEGACFRFTLAGAAAPGHAPS
jgi:signal transduction histidine kinase